MPGCVMHLEVEFPLGLELALEAGKTVGLKAVQRSVRP